ncbi:unnamed protein product [Caenorhabditis sp. 36 PRJEB53466]|nr:unnamed protein product [Caenorhabditis sp. 36 PRJEB53466]
MRRFLSSVHSSQPKLYEKLVKFETEKGKIVDLAAVYEDSLSAGSALGTVVGFHGSPGSHKDFKYIRHRLDDMGIRFIGVNYPGFKHTTTYPGQCHGNVERQRYSEALLNELDVQGKDRGRRETGVVELRAQETAEKGWRRSDVSFAQNSRVKVKDGEEAIAVIRTVQKCDLEKQLEHILKLNDMKTKTMITFGGRDHVVEKEIIFEALQKYKGLKHFSFKKDISDEERREIIGIFKDHKGASVFVASDNHFQNKKRADLVAEAVQSMLVH